MWKLERLALDHVVINFVDYLNTKAFNEARLTFNEVWNERIMIRRIALPNVLHARIGRSGNVKFSL